MQRQSTCVKCGEVFPVSEIRRGQCPECGGLIQADRIWLDSFTDNPSMYAWALLGIAGVVCMTWISASPISDWEDRVVEIELTPTEIRDVDDGCEITFWVSQDSNYALAKLDLKLRVLFTVTGNDGQNLEWPAVARTVEGLPGHAQVPVTFHVPRRHKRELVGWKCDLSQASFREPRLDAYLVTRTRDPSYGHRFPRELLATKPNEGPFEVELETW